MALVSRTKTTSGGSAAEEELRHDAELRQEERRAIETRAYEIYLERGAAPGRDVEDWLSAEKKLTSS